MAVKLEEDRANRPFSIAGTLWYMAPEVLDGLTQVKSDVWSLGITLIELADRRTRLLIVRMMWFYAFEVG